MFGIINETHLTLFSPRCIDDGPYDTIKEAMLGIAEMVQDDDEWAIVSAKWSERHTSYVEAGKTYLTVDARGDEWEDDEV